MGQRVGKRIRSSWGLLALVVAALMVAAMVPAAGDHLPGGDDPDGAGILRLHVGSDDRYFRHEPPEGPSKTQRISESRCELQLASSPSLASFTPNQRGKTGLNGISIGIKSGGAQGVPCGRVDSSETLMLNLGDVPLAARADLDLELKGNAKVKIETYLNGTKTESFEVRSGASAVLGEGVDGTSGEPFSVVVETDDPNTAGVNESIGNCKNLSDSGPDAGSRDNCRVTVHPSLPFDAIKLVPAVGEVSLEGSGDFSNDPAADTIFHLTTFEGVFDCGDSDSDSTDTVGGTITRHANADGSACLAKPYRLFVDTEDDGVVFELGDPATQVAFYEAVLTFAEETNTPPFEMTLEYDPEPPYGNVDEADGGNADGFKEAPACDQYPFEVDADGEDKVDSDGAKTLVSDAIPEGHEACVISVAQEWDGTTTWHAVFIGDWKFR